VAETLDVLKEAEPVAKRTLSRYTRDLNATPAGFMPKPFVSHIFLFFAAVTLLLVPLVLSQMPQEGPRLPDGGTRELLISIFIPSVPGTPFTAIVNTEWVRALPDGTRITIKNHRLIARDKVGRIFQERRMLVPDGGKQESFVTQTEISDPIAHQQTICVPRQQVCQLEVFYPSSATQPGMGKTAQETLGKQTIAGIETTGTKELMVVPTGAIGNDSPILSRREYWYSPQLGLNVLSIRDDPRIGTQKFELSDVVLGDPDANLFAPPEGYKVLDLRKETQTDPQETSPHN
jgi:hypothetical protein